MESGYFDGVEPLALPYPSVLPHLQRQLLDTHLQLWALEDRARARLATDAEIRQVKQRIDGLNAHRHQCIDAIDRELEAPPTAEGARRSAETVGEMLDRLLIVHLKRHHTRLLTTDAELSPEEQQSCMLKVVQLERWFQHLETCLAQLMSDLAAGQVQLPPRAEVKLYNNARLNPVLRREGATEAIDRAGASEQEG